MNDFGLMVGRYLSTLPTLTTTQVSELQLDASGRLIIAGRFLRDDAAGATDPGLGILAVRRDADTTIATADGNYAPLQLDADGRLKVATVVSVEPSDAEYAEDSAHTSGDTGIFVLSVRQDTLAASTSTDGDYGAMKVNALGELYVHDTDVKTELVAANASLDAMEADIDAIRTEIESITHAEDSAHSSGHAGIMALGVRNDANATLTSADGDYSPLATDSAGRLKTTAQIALEGTEQYTVTDALAAGGDGLITITAAATPWVTVASLVHTTGTAYLYGWQWACDQNADARIVTDDTTDVIVYKRTVNSSAMPGMSEHWSESGRIEIAGATDLEIKLQIKKRSSTGGNALGVGSLHIRTI